MKLRFFNTEDCNKVSAFLRYASVKFTKTECTITSNAPKQMQPHISTLPNVLGVQVAPKIWKNTKFVERDRETTNLVYAVGESVNEGEDFWAELTDQEYDHLQAFGYDVELAFRVSHLYTQAGTQYFGYL